MAVWESELIAAKFSTLLENLKIDPATQAIVADQFKAVTRQINLDFWGLDSETENSRLVGSYGRDTAIIGVNDIDIAVELPAALLSEYEQHPINGPAALLQAVQNSLQKVFPHPQISGDNRTIVLDYPGLEFEVLPVFLQEDQSYLYPQATRRGQWRRLKLLAEIEVIAAEDEKYQGKVKHLTKMMRAWKTVNQVPISGLLLETLAMDFLADWPQNQASLASYGQLTQDFLAFLAEQDLNQKHWLAKGSEQFVYRIGTFEPQAKASLEDARTALTYEKESLGTDSPADAYWKKIFGHFF